MKIIMCSNVVPIESSGVGTFINALASGLKQRGHDVDVISAFGYSKEFKTYKRGLVNRGILISRSQAILYVGYKAIQFLLAKKISDIMKAGTYDIIHAHDANAFNAVYPIAKQKGVPIIRNVHGLASLEGAAGHGLRPGCWLSKVLDKEEFRSLSEANHVVAVTDEIEEYIRKFVSDDSKISIFRNMVDTKKFNPRYRRVHEPSYTILSPNRLVRRKGLPYLLQAFAKVVATIDCQLIIAGDGPEKDNLKAIAKELGIVAQVRFVGEVANDRMAELLHESDIVVIPSISGEGGLEGTPMALLEAMASAVPVVASDLGGLPSVIQDGRTGLLVQERDSDGLARAITTLLTSERMMEEMGKASRCLIEERYSLETAAQAIERIYRGLAS